MLKVGEILKKQLSKRELDVMNVLWNSPKPLMASEIAQLNSALSINTVHTVLKSLLKNNFVEISDIVYSGTVLTRSYKPAIMAADYISEYFLSGNTLQTFSAFIKKEKDQKVLAELNDIIEQRMKDLSEDDSLWRN